LPAKLSGAAIVLPQPGQVTRIGIARSTIENREKYRRSYHNLDAHSCKLVAGYYDWETHPAGSRRLAAILKAE
jgi:hypothetical protein